MNDQSNSTNPNPNPHGLRLVGDSPPDDPPPPKGGGGASYNGLDAVVIRACNGDREELGELLRIEWRRLLAAARNDEDVLQDAYVLMLRGISSSFNPAFSNRGPYHSFQCWSWTVVANVWRKKSRGKPFCTISTDDLGELLCAPAVSPCVGAANREVVGILNLLLQSVPNDPIDRAIVELRVRQGQRLAVVANVLGVNPSTVRGRWLRFCRRLRPLALAAMQNAA